MKETENRPYVPRHAKKEKEFEIPVPEFIFEDIYVGKAEQEAVNEKTDTVTYERSYARSSSRRRKRPILIAFPAVAAMILLLFLCVSRLADVSVADIDLDSGSGSNPMDRKLRKMWLKNEEINPDYVGQIIFDSGLIDLPFVQAKDVYREDGSLYVFYTKDGQLVEDPTGFSGNDVYIWTSWKTGNYDYSDEGGSVFLDCRNSLDDINLIIYGHHYARDWDPSGRRQFTPLDLLLDEDGLAGNSTLRLILDNEIRRYEVAAVFVIDILDDDEIQVIRTDPRRDLSGNEDPEYENNYYSLIRNLSRYDIGTPIGEEDHLLTLVTCLEHQPRYRQIIVCRETGVELYG